MQMNVCDPHSGQNVLVGKYKLMQKCVRVCVCECMCGGACACKRTHGCINTSAEISCVFQQSGWFMPWILQCFRWDLREYTAICPNFPRLSTHTHTQARTHTLSLSNTYSYHTLYAHTHSYIYIYFPHYFQLKGQGQKTSVFRFESVRLQRDEGYKADSQNFLLQLKGNFLVLLWESMDKWDERTKEDKMIA